MLREFRCRLETFARICLKFQLDPAEALGLFWRDVTGDKDGVVTSWEVKDDFKLGGFRLYWSCDSCKQKNIEYLDGDGTILEVIEKIVSSIAYKATKAKKYSEALQKIQLMCEGCGLCYVELKGFDKWRQQNT